MPFKQLLVVFSNLLLDSRATDAGVAGQEVVSASVVYEIFTDKSRHGKLILRQKRLLGILARFLSDLCCFDTQIQQTIVTFKSFDVGINGAEFLFDGEQPLVDKLGCIVGRLVGISNPLFVVGFEKRIKHIFCTLWRSIGIAEIDYGSKFVGKLHRKASHTSASCYHRVYICDIQRVLKVFIKIFGAAKHYIAHRGLKRLSESHGASIKILRQAVNLHFADSDFVAGGTYHLKGHTLKVGFTEFLGKVFKFYRQGCFFIPIGDVSNPILACIGDVDTQAIHHILHQCGRLKRLQLVIYVDAGGTDAEVGKSGKLTDLRLTATIATKHHACRALIDALAACHIQNSYRKAHNQRNQEKFLMTKCPSDDIAYLKFVFLLVKFDV